MSTHKHFDKICCVILAVTLVLTVLFMSAESFGVQKASTVMRYEKKLFDTSNVHTIDIIMEDWDDFIKNCTSEEYSNCTVMIDNDAYKNVAIRAKGNTSLTQVASYGNDRYSFKIEFDHYDSTNTYYGLDKLCLNNIIQDNTYMKDYLCYQMMRQMNVASPLCSYAYLTVNGEDWGLYLAVEAVEESFLQRNYGKDYGEVYKPDSMKMGGGRGNGKDFDMDEAFGNSKVGEFLQDNDIELPEDFDAENFDPGNLDMKNFDPGNFDPKDFNSENADPGNFNAEGSTSKDSISKEADAEISVSDKETQNNQTEKQRSVESNHNGRENKENSDHKMSGGPGGMDSMKSSDDVLLKYIDDDAESYSNIFENAKTDVSERDQARLIESLKNLSAQENLSDTVNIETVIQYFVVHNFVLNFDSYTGSMIHNYYLYEKDGQMEMIPWDYNLAFGGFKSMGDASSLINYPIDSPVSDGNVEDRPMIAWIFADEEYTELYHKYFSEFIEEYFESGYFETMIDEVSAMITPYVEKDPTKFCTYEEFETGISTLREFCLLRAESVRAQLDGSIGTTSDSQESDTLIDAGNLQISDMGSMDNSMGKGNSFGDFSMEKPNMQTHDDTDSDPSSTAQQNDNRQMQPPGSFQQDGNGQMQPPGGFQQDGNGQMQPPDALENPDTENDPDETSWSN